ncbi:hypothetical protein FA13DRAFT_1723794 [Coprinellus micaceus]|uniref:Uncharacterized protein n=1 Tax=Coprinellus micaceus TaxID=71717 RepID=A0A4Y7TZH6_COPMI|nr:hypothetical protein FA13DRAFT_1723794 [Coprinellus micaceus]
MSNSNARLVFVDDSYPGIRYRGPWFESTDSLADSGSSGPIYQGSQRGVNDTASFTFSFSGTDLAVYGTSAVTRSVSTTQIDPQWSCVVDGAQIAYREPSQQPQNLYPLCDSAPMSDGPHNLTVVVSSIGGTVFWFDFLMVRLSPSSKEIEHPAVFYPFSDPAVQYTAGQWTNLPGKQGMLTQQVGTKVTWYGRMISGYPSGPSTGTYSIDGGAPVSFPIDGLLFNYTTRYQQIIFETPDIPMGKHNITVKYLGASTPLVLEYLVVQDGDLMFTGSEGPNPIDQDHPHQQPKTGILVGAIMGGLALLAMLGVIVFLLRKLRQRRRVKWLKEIDEGSPKVPQAMPPQYMVEATPFIDARGDRTPTNSPPTTPSPSASAAFTDGILSLPASHGSASMLPQHQSLSNFISSEKVRQAYLSGASPPSSTALLRPMSSVSYNASGGAHYASMSPSNLGATSLAGAGAQPRPSTAGSTSDEKVRMEYEHGIAVNRPLALVNAPSESEAPVTLVHHEDSGLRLAPDPHGAPTVLDVPPSYTPR